MVAEGLTLSGHASDGYRRLLAEELQPRQMKAEHEWYGFECIEDRKVEIAEVGKGRESAGLCFE
jgi:hypothetical protein